jgi:hypothetical protein
MTVITTRIYDTHQNATGAVAKLKQSHFTDEQISVVSGDGKTAEQVVAAIKAAGLPAAYAKVSAEAVGLGGSFVAVRPAFGKAGEAAEILNSFSPTSSEDIVVTEETSAPLSSGAGWSTLLADPHPLSSYFNWKLLSEDRLGLSKKFNWALLSEDRFPVSKLFGWKLLSDVATPVSKAFSWKLLSDDPTPLSSKYKWTLLIDNPTPLSSKFGLTVLSKE